MFKNSFYYQVIRRLFGYLPGGGDYVDNVIIEFFGAAGVGKSTLCNKLFDSYSFCIRGIITNRRELERYSKIRKIELDNFYCQLLSMKIKDLSVISRLSDLQKDQLIDYYKRVLKIDTLITKSSFENATVLLDDGLTHNFTRQLRTFSDKSLILTYLKKRILVYCTGSPDFIFRNLKKRMQEGKGTPIDESFSSNDSLFYTHICKTLEEKKSFIDYMEEMGITIIEVNTEMDYGSNIDIIKEKLCKLIKYDSCY